MWRLCHYVSPEERRWAAGVEGAPTVQALSWLTPAEAEERARVKAEEAARQAREEVELAARQAREEVEEAARQARELALWQARELALWLAREDEDSGEAARQALKLRRILPKVIL